MARRIKTANDFAALRSLAMLEGSYEGIEFSNNSVVAPTTGSATVGGGSLTPTEAFILEGVSMSVRGGYAAVQVQYYAGPNNALVGSTSHRQHLTNGSVSFPVSAILTPGSTFSCSLRDGDGTTSLAASAQMTGIRITADTNMAARKVFLVIGDSNARGTTMGGTAYSDVNALNQVTPLDHYAFQVRDFLNSHGEDCRLVIKAMGSFTSRHMGAWLKRGWLTIPQVDGILYVMGTNDATGPTTNGEFTDELNRLIQWRSRHYPTAPLILGGPTPLNNNTHEARLIELRALMAGMANVKAGIYYCSLANAFIRTDLNNYTSSDGVHFTIPNHVLVANTINNFIQTNNIRL